MQRYEEITEELFQQARIKTDQRFVQECAAASPGARKVITYIRQNAYRPLSVPEIRRATGFNGSLKAILVGAKSFGAYLGSARIKTAATMNAAQRVPTGCIMRRVGVTSCSTFRRLYEEHANEPLVLFKAPELLSPDFDALSWYQLVTGMPHDTADVLAERLCQGCPTAWQAQIEPTDVAKVIPREPGPRQKTDPKAALALAAEKPLRTVDWACDAMVGCFKPLMPYLKENLFDSKRTNLRPLELKVAREVVEIPSDGGLSYHLLFFLGEAWESFRNKRLVEAALDLLVSQPVPVVAELLGLSRDLLDTWFHRRTGASVGAVEQVILRSANLHAFKVWMAAGRNGVGSLRDDEARSLGGLLEGAVPGCCAALAPAAEPGRDLAAVPLVEPVAEPLPEREDWTLLGALAEALDYSARDPETQKKYRQGVLQSPLHEDVINLEWFAARLGYARGACDSENQHSWYKTALTEWKTASEQIIAPLPAYPHDTPLVWACIHRYKEASATPDRSRWLDFAETVLKPEPSHGFGDYRRSLDGLLKAYRAMEVIVFNPEDLDTAGSLVAAAGSMMPPGADPWIFTEIKNITALFYHSVGNREAAIQMLRESHDISTRFQMAEQEAATVQVMAFVQVHYGIATEKELSNVLDKQVFLSRRMFNQVQLCRVQDQLYFSWELNHTEVAAQLAELARNLQGHQPTEAWITTLEGLLLLRVTRFRAACTKFSDAKETFESCHNPVKKHWAEVFLAVSLFADGQTEQAMPHAWVAATFFSANTHGQVRDCALQCLAAPTAAAIAQLARTMVCPQAAAEALAQGQIWGAITRMG